MRRKDRQITDQAQIIDIFNQADACRVAFAVSNEPYIVTMNFGYVWNGALPVLYFHCARQGRKLDMMRLNNRVCFQIDTRHVLQYNEGTEYCTMLYNSIVGMGCLGEVTDEHERISGLNLLMQHYGHGAPVNYSEASLTRVTILRLTVTELTAKAKS